MLDQERRGFGARGKEKEVENSLTWWEKKEKKNSKWNAKLVNIYSYCSNNENLYKFNSTYVGQFLGKMCKIVYFFYFGMTDVVALRWANSLLIFFTYKQ